jgi:(R,R)-butanediol dehydrogenase / meso-butanediol dehydrogenase / diacetyl reductase
MTMRAARWHGRRDIRIDTVPVPRPGPGEVLVRVERVGLCGSDLEEFLHGPVGIPAAPLTLGHEIVGVVAESADPQLPVGTAVVPDVVVGCGQCWWCARHEEGLCPRLSVRGQQQDGGLAEFMLADAATCIPVPVGLDLDIAAFAEPTAVAVRALRKAGDLAGAVICVYGAGTVGQLVAQVALASGCAAVVAVDPVADRRDLARGAIACTPDDAADAVAAVSSGRGADVVVECAGIPGAPASALRLCRRGGTVVLVGFRPEEIALPWLAVVLGERTIVGSAAHLWDVDVAAAVALLHRGVVDPRPLHTATLPLDEVPAAFERLTGDRSVLKLLIAP